MFGISFSELLLIGLVALLVLGPERLPGAARTAGLWVGRLKRSFNAIKREVEREIGADEIRRQLHNEQILALEREIKQSIQPPAGQPTAGSPEVLAAALHPEPRPDVAAPPADPLVDTPPGVQPAMSSVPGAPSPALPAGVVPSELASGLPALGEPLPVQPVTGLPATGEPARPSTDPSPQPPRQP